MVARTATDTGKAQTTHGKAVREITGKRIAIFAEYPSFLTDIIAYLSQRNDVRCFERPMPERIAQMSGWADLVWFEWCDQLLIHASHQTKGRPIVCRIHSYEVFTDMPGKVNWPQVDQLIFVNDSVRQLFERQVRCTTPRTVIHNGVDTDRYVIPPEKPRTKKIASVGFINYKKNPALLLYCFKKIHEYDPSYSLHIAGTFQDSRYQLYFEHFLKQHPLPVVFDGWVSDMPAWYADKDFVISTSLFESFHYSIAEGMASGLLPLVHDWYGAENLYPREYLFSDPDKCLALLQRLESADRRALQEQNRRHIIDRFDTGDTCRQVAHLLGGVVNRTYANNEVKA